MLGSKDSGPIRKASLGRLSAEPDSVEFTYPTESWRVVFSVALQDRVALAKSCSVKLLPKPVLAPRPAVRVYSQ
jgi:hypothetical protein